MKNKKTIILTASVIIVLVIAGALFIKAQKEKKEEWPYPLGHLREMTEEEKVEYEQNYEIIREAANYDVAHMVNELCFYLYCNHRTESMGVLAAVRYDNFVILILKDGSAYYYLTSGNDVVGVMEQAKDGKILFSVVEDRRR